MSDPDRAQTTPGDAAHLDPTDASDSPETADSRPIVELRDGVTPGAGEAPGQRSGFLVDAQAGRGPGAHGEASAADSSAVQVDAAAEDATTEDTSQGDASSAPGDARTAQDDARGASTTPAALPDPIPHAGLRYAALRLLMLASVGGILYVIGLRGWLLAFAAVLVSGIVSLFLFMRQRNDAAVNLEHSIDHWKHRHTENEETPQ